MDEDPHIAQDARLPPGAPGQLDQPPPAESCAEPCPLDQPPPVPEPIPLTEVREILLEGDNRSDRWEQSVAQVARASGAIEVALGEVLAALQPGDRLVSLGFSCLGDFAREVLGIGERKAQAMAHLARGLSTRPLLRAAVRSGQVCIRAAEEILPVARGEAEAGWVRRARSETVNTLKMAVREARRGAGEEEDDRARFRTALTADERTVLDAAFSMAETLMPGSSRAQQLEAVAQEYLGQHPAAVEVGEDGRRLGPAFRTGPREKDVNAEQARLEAETLRWSYLLRVEEVAAPDPKFDCLTARELEAEARRLSDMRDRWDALLGHGAYTVQKTGLWRVLGFASFGAYCEERLGMSARAVGERVSLERRLWTNRPLRAARDKGLSYEKVRLLSKLPPGELLTWLPKARALTAIALRRALREHQDAQIRAAMLFGAWMPSRVAGTVDEAVRTARATHGRLLRAGTCLALMAAHFIQVWRPVLERRKTLSQRVRERDLGRCTVPGCSRPAAHSHHVQPKAQLGSDDLENQTGICAVHHRALHDGHLRVWGLAPHFLTWELGGRLFTGSFRDEGG